MDLVRPQLVFQITGTSLIAVMQLDRPLDEWEASQTKKTHKKNTSEKQKNLTNQTKTEEYRLSCCIHPSLCCRPGHPIA